MAWYLLAPRGASRDLWLDVTGPDEPRWGRWTTPIGLDVANTLGDVGPGPIEVEMWWEPTPEHYGKRLTDLVWQSGLLGLKLGSERLVGLLSAQGADIQVFDLDIRWRTGDPVAGYVGFLEPVDGVGPVRSSRPGERNHEFLVDQPVFEALRAAELTGIDFAAVKGLNSDSGVNSWKSL